MKHLAILLGFLGLSASVLAQEDPGTFSVIPRVGLNLSTISHESLTTSLEPLGSKTKAGAMAGVDLEYRITPGFAASIGAFYSREGCNYHDTDLSKAGAGTYDVLSHSYFTIDYLKVPLMARYYVVPQLSVGAGVQAGFGLWNRTHTETQEVTIGENGSYTYSTDITKSNVKGNGLTDVVWSVPVSVAVEYENVIVDLRYSFPLSKVYKNSLKSGGSKMRCWCISVGYRI